MNRKIRLITCSLPTTLFSPCSSVVFTRMVSKLRFFILLIYIVLPLSCDIVDKRFKNIQLDEKGFENVKQLHHNWYLYSIKALIVQLTKHLKKEMSIGNIQTFGNCLKEIKFVKEVHLSAKCLFDARRRHLLEKSLISLNRRRIKYRSDKEKLQSYRSKRSPHRLIEPKQLQIKKLSKAPSLLEMKRKPIKSMSNLLLSIFSQSNTTMTARTWMETYSRLLNIQKQMSNPKQHKNSVLVYNKRMYDIVMEPDASHKAKSNMDVGEILNLVTNISPGKESNLRILSPRLFPIVADDKRRQQLLSPAIFPLYKDESENQILPIPEMLEGTGMDKDDQETILQTIMELSGARKTVESALKVLKHMQSFGISDSLIEVSNNITETFKKMRKSFSKNQKKDLKDDGFVFLESNQIEKLHNEHGLDKYETNFNLTQYKELSMSERWVSLWATVEELAYGKEHVRPKRQVGPVVSTRNLPTPLSVMQPVVLRPYIFQPVYGVSILGPVVLSPNAFSPLILNPSILGPWVLSPAVPLPFILSPYVLSPYVLSPLVMAPFILTPYVLSPNVINPYVLSPLILSPTVLCPDVLSPMVLGGAILSPGVGSPSVLSKSILMANVLSPTIFS